MNHLVTLGEFLRAARARLEPADVGFPTTARRRVAGLRREELAQLAGVSVDYYTRLEQGRSGTASRAVLDSLASALHLDDAERVHLFNLAAQPERVHRPSSAFRQRATPVVEQLLARLDTAYCPAFVLGRRTDVLAGNRLAAALITDFAALPQHERNQARFVFLDPYARELYADWEGVAADTAAMLRMDAGRHGANPELSELVSDLSRQSPAFRRMWADQRVIERTEGTKGYHHPVVGDLMVAYQAMALAGEEDQTLFVYTTPVGTADETALRLLATWASSAAALTSPKDEPLRK